MNDKKSRNKIVVVDEQKERRQSILLTIFSKHAAHTCIRYENMIKSYFLHMDIYLKYRMFT